jgi:hypothetical protein
MTNTLVPIAFFVFLAFVTVGIGRIISDARTRRQLIQAKLSPEHAQAILAEVRRAPDPAGTLRLALVIGSVGLALVLLQFLPYDASEPIGYGLVLVFAAAGLLAHLALARRVA